MPGTLDSQDYTHAIDDIHRRLHDGKVALLVGAGFSLNSIPRSPDGRRFPLWPELTEGLVARLYPDKSEQKRVLKRSGATSAALRLAQEFEEAFDRPGLVELVRDVIRDEEFIPGPLFASLLELPWADIFTTNYDRLLEDAARTLWKRRYELVLRVSDLPIARRPRIVKLHGSLPDLDGMILTEDDFRRYPQDYAPFVTSVLASLTENVLCLIGFSGDDPNFLAWSGWLRDELGKSTPKTYLFTVNDKLRPFQKRLLEKRNIIPIPLCAVSRMEAPAEAFNWLFGRLKTVPGPRTPWWNISPAMRVSAGTGNAADEPRRSNECHWFEATMQWREHRLNYQGWYVLDEDAAESILSWTDDWLSELKKDTVEAWSPSEAIVVLRELTWRWSKALMPLPDDFVADVVEPQLKRFRQYRAEFTGSEVMIEANDRRVKVTVAELNDAYAHLVQESIRHARETANEERFSSLCSELLEQSDQSTADSVEWKSFVEHQQILSALSRLQRDEAKRRLCTWDTNRCDVIWTIRRAGLSLELGLYDLARTLLTETLDELRSGPARENRDYRRLSAEGLVLRLTLPLVWLDDVRISRQKRQRTDDSENRTAPRELAPGFGSRIYTSSGFPNNAAGSEDDGNTEEDSRLRDRLRDLRQFGCDIRLLEQSLLKALPDVPRHTRGGFEYEGFRIGTVGETFSSGRERTPLVAWQSLRLIEEAGLPLSVPEVDGFGSLIIADKLFQKAVETIAVFSPKEGCGVALRSCDEKTMDKVFFRSSLVQLSQSQVESLFASAESALKQTTDRLCAEAMTLSRQDEAPLESLFADACRTMKLLVVRLDDDAVFRLAETMTRLQVAPNLRGRWRCQSAVAACIRVVADCLTRDQMKLLLPSVLAAPVPGENEFPETPRTYDGWDDLATTVDEFKWGGRRVLDRQASASLDDLIDRMGRAEKWGRQHLCLRLVHLMDVGVLSRSQKLKFRDVLFQLTDESGFPEKTGCIDSFVLTLPKKDGFREREAFARKYLNLDAVEKVDWRTIRQTRNHPRESSRRQINWSRHDLSVLIDLSSRWLRQLVATESQNRTVQSSGYEAERHRREMLDFQLPNWLLCIDNLVIRSPRATPEIRKTAVSLLETCEHAGLCVALCSPSVASTELWTADRAIAQVTAAIGSRERSSVMQGCTAVESWAAMSNSQFKLPESLITVVVNVVSSRRHEETPLLLNTLKYVFRSVSRRSQAALLDQLTPCLTGLLEDTVYQDAKDHSGNKNISIGRTLRIRVACSQFVAHALEVGHRQAILKDWTESIQNDLFADVRQSVERGQ